MAVLKLEEDILLMMTDNEVTNQLGLTEKSQESNLHCLFLSKTSRKQKGIMRKMQTWFLINDGIQIKKYLGHKEGNQMQFSDLNKVISQNLLRPNMTEKLFTGMLSIKPNQIPKRTDGMANESHQKKTCFCIRKHRCRSAAW